MGSRPGWSINSRKTGQDFWKPKGVCQQERMAFKGLKRAKRHQVRATGRRRVLSLKTSGWKHLEGAVLTEALKAVSAKPAPFFRFNSIVKEAARIRSCNAN